MVSVIIYKKNGSYYRVECSGHAGDAPEGENILCAAISALVVNCFNSVERFTEDFVSSETSKDGITSLQLKENISHDTELLVKSLELGLNEISKDNGKYLKISVKEV
ncbi:MAG: ribosomal-processing cysteine protease Prp [Lachnospiraceae bacterium]|nr:ribosomal-processing cysteine protease Prp [Lachnospiraceae bacterium]